MARRPYFWIEFGSRLGKALLPLAWRYVSKRMPPDEEATWRQVERRGQGDVWVRERYRVRRNTQLRAAQQAKASPKLSQRGSPASERGTVKA